MNKPLKEKVFSGLLLSFLTVYFTLSSGLVNAATLDLTPAHPDITTSSAAVSYTFTDLCFKKNQSSGESGPCGTGGGGPNGFSGDLDTANSFGLLEITGASMTLQADDSGDFSFITAGPSYSLTAAFDGFGLWDISGTNTLEVLGKALTTTAPFDDFQSGTLVTGDLFNFGFGTGVIEYEFNNIGGDFSQFGRHGGIIIGIAGGTSPAWVGDWDPDDDTVNVFFQRDFTATANIDTFVPVPAAVWLFASGFVALLGVAKRRVARV